MRKFPKSRIRNAFILLVTLSVTSIVAVTPVEAGLIVIDFDDVTAPELFEDQSTQLTTEYAALGVTFTNPPTEDANEIVNTLSFSVPSEATGPNILASRGERSIEGFFSIPVFSVGAIIGISDGQDTLNIFDTSNNLIDSVLGDDVFVSLSSSDPISRFTVVATNSTTPAIDNLTFATATAVPAPLPVSLMAIGLLGMGLAPRKLRRF